ncbi:hypothetical protein [uncultured Shewanella sp.]|uniref:hypothetical protein n=1 Tax=uncultured Shewanella sp. TaxID=173975 RepID=UPI00261122FA|nr:hypothetical protein [uncultured Shewanella sp.]
MDNLFEQAVSRSETERFFKGEGQYYSHNPMDGGHCYGIRLSGNLAQYLNNDKHNLYIFNEVFNHFIASLSSSEADLRHLLANVFEINRLKNNGVLSGVNFVNEEGSLIMKSIQQYFKQLEVSEANKELVNIYLAAFEDLDSKLLVNIMNNYMDRNN